MPFLSGFKNAGGYIWQALTCKKPCMAYVGGWQGANNLGDVAFYDCMKTLFHRFGFLQYRHTRSIQLAAKMLPVFQSAVLSGGTVINRQIGTLLSAEEAIQLCRHFIVFGTGVANPSYWSTQTDYENLLDRWKPILNRCLFVGVRGPMSAEILIEAGIDNVEVVGDPVLPLASYKENAALSYEPKTLGLNIGQSNGLVWGSEDEICVQFANLSSLAKKSNWKVEWFVVYPKDLPITRRAAALSETEEVIHEIYSSPEKYINLTSVLSAFVGMKLHSVIFANCAFVPSVMLEYRPKCLDYMKSIGHEAYNIRTDQFKGEEVWEIVKEFDAHRDHYSQILKKEVVALKERQASKAEELMTQILKE